MNTSKARDIAIIGAGGFAREVAWLINDINQAAYVWNLLGYIESNSELVGQACGTSSIIGDDDFLMSYNRELAVVIGIGDPKVIERIHQRIKHQPNLRFPNLIHPSVIWDRAHVQLGCGNIICAGNILTTDIRIGSFNILNLASTYGHDVVIGDYCVINPGVNLSGRVRVGDACLLGTGAVVLERLVIGDHVTVGGGAVVTKNIESGLTVVGIPAKPIVHHQA